MSKWSISERGLLYDMYKTEDNINATRSDEIFEALYSFAQKNKQFAKKLAKREQKKNKELETKLNRQYKNKAIKTKDGLNWFVTRIKVLNEKEVEIELTDLSRTQVIKIKLEQLPKMFKN